VHVACQNGYVTLASRASAASPLPEDLRRNLQYEASLAARNHGAARFTNDGAWTLLVVAAPPFVDGVTRALLEGVRHEAIGTDAMPPSREPIPARLSQWTGRELGPRVVAVGGSPTYEWPTGHGRSVMFLRDGVPGSLELMAGDPDTWLPMLKGPTGFAWAADDHQLLVCFGAQSLCARTFLDQVLGATTAKRFGTGP
jgi:hypothetical protein